MATIELLSYLAIGALSGLLAGLFGVGGGIVMVPGLIFLFGSASIVDAWVPHIAVGTSLATIIATGAASTFAHHRRAAVRWDLVARLAPGILAGVAVSAAVAAHLPDIWLKRAFALFLAYVGFRMLLLRGPAASGRALPGNAGMIAAGVGIGLISALVGIGGGTMTVPFLGGRGLDLRKAVGTSAAVGLPIAIAGTVGFVAAGWGRPELPANTSGFVYWPAVLAMSVASVPLAPIGARIAHKLPIQSLRRIFGSLLLLVAARLALS